MIALLIVSGYFAGFTLSAVAASRWAASHIGRCHSVRYRMNFHDNCESSHGVDCWRPDGVVRFGHVLIACAASLVWPVAAIPAVVYLIASRTPTHVAIQQSIAQLERELGIGGDR